MLNFLSFMGASLVFAILFSFVNNFHMKQEEEHKHSFLEKFSLFLMLPLFLFGLPVIIICSPINKLAAKQLESVFKRDLSIKYDMLLDTYQKRQVQLENEISSLKEKLLDEQLTHHQEEYKSGERAGFRSGFRTGFSSCYDSNNLPKENKWKSIIDAWDSIDINIRLCNDKTLMDE